MITHAHFKKKKKRCQSILVIRFSTNKNGEEREKLLIKHSYGAVLIVVWKIQT